MLSKNFPIWALATPLAAPTHTTKSALAPVVEAFSFAHFSIHYYQSYAVVIDKIMKMFFVPMYPHKIWTENFEKQETITQPGFRHRSRPELFGECRKKGSDLLNQDLL